LTGVIRSEYDGVVLKLRVIREQRRLSLRVLSRKAGVGLATLVRVEAGKFDPRLSTLRKLAKALRVTVCQLLGEQPKKGGR